MEITRRDWDDVIRKLEDRWVISCINCYHLSPPRNHDSIMQDGLRSADGGIFVADTLRVLGSIAINQVFTKTFNLYGVKVARSWLVEPDDVGELTSKYQWIIRRPEIPRSRIVYMGRFVAQAPFDTFMPLPEELLARMPAGQRREFARGFWPPGALAYFYPVNGPSPKANGVWKSTPLWTNLTGDASSSGSGLLSGSLAGSP